MNPTSFQRFQNDLKATLLAGVPVEIGSKDSVSSNNRLTIAELSHLESLILPGITSNESLTETLDSQPEIPARYRAALIVFDRTASMLAVLDGLTIRRFAQGQAKRVLRWTLIYLLILLAVAFVGMRLYTTQVLPALALMRADMLLPAAINAPDRFDLMPWLPIIVQVLGWSLLVMLVLMLAGGASKIAMWLGGNHFVRCRLSTMALRVTQMLVEAGTPIDEAVTLSCDLTGADARVRRNIRTAVEASHRAQNLDALADYLTIVGNDRLAHMKMTTPIALVSVIGGGIALLYCVTIFWPIISMLKDLSTAGT